MFLRLPKWEHLASVHCSARPMAVRHHRPDLTVHEDTIQRCGPSLCARTTLQLATVYIEIGAGTRNVGGRSLALDVNDKRNESRTGATAARAARTIVAHSLLGPRPQPRRCTLTPRRIDRPPENALETAQTQFGTPGSPALDRRQTFTNPKIDLPLRPIFPERRAP